MRNAADTQHWSPAALPASASGRERCDGGANEFVAFVPMASIVAAGCAEAKGFDPVAAFSGRELPWPKRGNFHLTPLDIKRLTFALSGRPRLAVGCPLERRVRLFAVAHNQRKLAALTATPRPR